ncbi:MAG: hypothetical protein AAFO07_27605 [Bacteroidota bacterium]
MKPIFLCWCMIIMIALTSACNQSNGGSIETMENQKFDPNSFTIESVPGSDYEMATRRDSMGVLLEMGYLKDNTRHGVWSSYHPNGLPKKVASYINGVFNGIYQEFNERGQLILMAHYKNNLLDGPWGKYNFGRPEMTANYVGGQLNGVYREYDPTRLNVMLKEIEYKNGVYDGKYRFFNSEGVMTVEYVYRNGNKISGGIVEQSGE